MCDMACRSRRKASRHLLGLRGCIPGTAWILLLRPDYHLSMLADQTRQLVSCLRLCMTRGGCLESSGLAGDQLGGDDVKGFVYLQPYRRRGLSGKIVDK